jgi:hypothetical protein
VNRAAQIVEALLAPSKPLLVIVHPGSLCGSYHSSSSFSEAGLKALLQEIHAWTGDCAIVHGDLSDELDDYREIRDAVNAMTLSGAEEYEAEATDRALAAAAKEIARDFKVEARPQVLVTGAWVGKSGCVSYVAYMLKRFGAKVSVSSHAAKGDF